MYVKLLRLPGAMEGSGTLLTLVHVLGVPKKRVWRGQRVLLGQGQGGLLFLGPLSPYTKPS